MKLTRKYDIYKPAAKFSGLSCKKTHIITVWKGLYINMKLTI